MNMVVDSSVLSALGPTWKPIPRGPRPLFVVSADVMAAMDFNETFATLEALDECGLLRLPYDFFDMKFNMEDYATAPGWGADKERLTETWITITFGSSELEVFHHATRGKEIRALVDPELFVEFGDGQNMLFHANTSVARTLDGQVLQSTPPEGTCAFLKNASINMGGLLAAALATRNIVKHTNFNKRAARGIGNGGFRSASGVIYLNRTTLSVPAEFTAGTGKRVRFHLRRGHVHTFLVGQGRSEKVKKFVAAMLVNRDLQQHGTVPAPEYAL